MQDVDFFKLPRAVQDRIVGGLRGEFPPSPLAREELPRQVPWRSLVLLAAGVLLLLAVIAAGFGEMGPLGNQPVAMIGVYLVAGSLIGLAVAGWWWPRAREGTLPYASGVYLYASRILRCDGQRVTTLPIDERSEVQETPRGVLVVAEGQRFEFACDAMAKAAALSMIGDARSALAEHGPASTFARDVDPLEQPPPSAMMGSGEPMRRREPSWMRPLAAAMVVAPALLAALLFPVRNRLSDERVLAQVVLEDSVAGYERYLGFHGPSSAAVRSDMLPRAQLRDAMATGEVAPLLALPREGFPASLLPTYHHALQQAYEGELQARISRADLAGVRGFLTDRPESGLQRQVGEAVGMLYGAVERRIKGQDEHGAKAMVAALRSAREHGVVADVVWTELPSSNLTNLEKVLTRVPEYGGDRSRPSHHYSQAQLREQAQRTTTAFAEAVAAVVPPDYMRFAWNDTVSPGRTSLQVRERIEWDGSAMRSQKPKGVFVGLTYELEARLQVPEWPTPYQRKLSVRKKISSQAVKEAHARAPEQLEHEVYLRLLAEAHEELLQALRRDLLGGA